LNQIVLGLIKW